MYAPGPPVVAGDLDAVQEQRHCAHTRVAIDTIAAGLDVNGCGSTCYVAVFPSRRNHGHPSPSP
jgi:hypothetical protein